MQVKDLSFPVHEKLIISVTILRDRLAYDKELVIQMCHEQTILNSAINLIELDRPMFTWTVENTRKVNWWLNYKKKKKVLRLKSRPWCINKTRKRENEKKKRDKVGGARGICPKYIWICRANCPFSVKSLIIIGQWDKWRKAVRVCFCRVLCVALALALRKLCHIVVCVSMRVFFYRELNFNLCI